jgi:hypothetical protein
MRAGQPPDRTRTPLSAGNGENGFLDLGDGEMSDLLKLDMRHVRHLVRRHDGIDNRRAIDGESIACLQKRNIQGIRFQ